MKQRNNWYIPIILTVALTLVGCNRKVVFSQYQSVNPQGWQQADSLCFCITSLETAGTYETELGLRSYSSYPYTSVALIVHQQTTLSNISITDTIDIDIVDSEGKKQGKGFSVKTFSHVLRPLSLVEGDTVCVSIHHFMRHDPLPGIADVGYTLTLRGNDL